MGEFNPIHWVVVLGFFAAILGVPWLAYRHSRKLAERNHAPYGALVVSLTFTTLAASIVVFGTAARSQTTGDVAGTRGVTGWLLLVVGAGYWARRTWYEVLRVEAEPAFRQKHRSFQLVVGIVICAILAISGACGVYFGTRAKHFSAIKSITEQFNVRAEKALSAKQRFIQIASRKTPTVEEYIQRCADLEGALNDYEPFLHDGDRLYGQMLGELEYLKADEGYAKMIPMATVMQGIFRRDIESARAFRKEIEFAKQLTSVPVQDRGQFFQTNIVPIKNDERKISNEEIQILKDAKARGVQLPQALYDNFGVQ